MTKLIGPGALRLDRRLAGPSERVWAHLVEPDRRATWLARGELEPRLGGLVTLAFRHDDLTDAGDPPPDAYRSVADGGHVARGVVTNWDPPRRLAHTWEDGAEASEVAFELIDEGDAVRLTLTHRRLDTRAAMVSVAAGWDAHLGLLAAVLTGTPRPAYWRSFVASVERHTEAFAGRAEADGRPTGFAALRTLAGGGQRVEFDRVVAAPVAAVWRALAEPELRDHGYPSDLRSVGVDLVLDGQSTRVAFAGGFGDRALAPEIGAGWHAWLDALAAVAEGRGVATDAPALRREYAVWLAGPIGELEDGAVATAADGGV